MNFREYLSTFDELIGRARAGTIDPADFQGTTNSLTNPGTVGTVASMPRLMPGQGAIIATGAIDYPAEFSGMDPRTQAALGISKVMMISSTYDHRIIQGAESGLFLAKMHALLLGEGDFYSQIFSDLKIPYHPVRWSADRNPALFGGPAKREENEKQARVLLLIHAYRVRGHLIADLDPLEGIESISLTGSQAGIITNDRHNDARVIEVRPIRVLDELDKGKVVVIGGFRGVSYKRDITTLGRGGSDTSAVALAAALNAERCEIYSDVDGVYTTDPNIVKDAKHLPEISYQQIQEMAEAGAKVLNAQAVQFAKEAKIALYARDTFNPGKETIIKDVTKKELSGVLAVVYEKAVLRVFIHDEAKINWVLEYLEEKQIPIIRNFRYQELPGIKVTNAHSLFQRIVFTIGKKYKRLLKKD